jgi:ribosome-associated protein
MQPIPVRERKFEVEFKFQASRSSGPGGQHVNKVSSRVELRFNINASQLLSDDEKTTLTGKLHRYINHDGIIIISEQSSRSQYKNKENTINRFYEMIDRALKPVKKRKATRPTAASKERRLELKRYVSEKKARRRTIGPE